MKDFKDYLFGEFGKGYAGTDDCMPDEFEDWLCEIDPEDLISYANKWAETLTPPQKR